MYGDCESCQAYGPLEIHHIYEGRGRRMKSDRYGAVIAICPRCHRHLHDNPREMIPWKQTFQVRLMAENNWTVEDFIREFGRSYV